MPFFVFGEISLRLNTANAHVDEALESAGESRQAWIFSYEDKSWTCQVEARRKAAVW